MATVPAELAAKNDRGGWLPAVSYCPALLCSALLCSAETVSTRSQLITDSQLAASIQDRRDPRPRTHCKGKTVITTSRVGNKPV
jgi:hypothetical protein